MKSVAPFPTRKREHATIDHVSRILITFMNNEHACMGDVGALGESKYQKEYRRKYLQTKVLFSIRLDGAQYQDVMRINKATMHIFISHTWFRNEWKLIKKTAKENWWRLQS